MSKQYLAILGRQPELGLVELESILGAEAVSPLGSHALLTQLPNLDHLGGTIKLGEVLYFGKITEVCDLPLDWAELIADRERKTIFGLSYYGGSVNPRTITATGLEIKKRLRQSAPARFVAPSPGQTTLSAAQLIHQHVLYQGFELLVVTVDHQMWVARALGVQDIEAYSQRDYDRPERSARTGMLPPKLAQILVNSTHADLVSDPFCGTGVVLQEALLMGRRAFGSDLSPQMVGATTANLNWLAETHSLPEWRVEPADGRQVTLPADTAIVTEGYLGPPLTSPPGPAQIKQLSAELDPLYRTTLAHWATILPSGAEVSLCLPSWRTAGGWSDLEVIDELPRLGYTFKKFAHVRAGQLRYSRTGQIVGRKILLLTRV